MHITLNKPKPKDYLDCCTSVVCQTTKNLTNSHFTHDTCKFDEETYI